MITACLLCLLLAGAAPVKGSLPGNPGMRHKDTGGLAALLKGGKDYRDEAARGKEGVKAK